jgi:thymidylate synthase ThyX
MPFNPNAGTGTCHRHPNNPQVNSMNPSATIVADSVADHGARITTLELCYQRFIHSEVMTHRAFSRNAMSSRAVPVAKMIEQVRNHPAMPSHWGMNQPGMQASTEADAEVLLISKGYWDGAARDAADTAEKMNRLGLHKQVVNRILEPFQWMRTIVTATEWDNFFELRLHPDAQPEFQVLAGLIKDAMDASVPTERRGRHDWHLPYVSAPDREKFPIITLRKLSGARCARVSYLTHEGSVPTPQKDTELFDRLVGSVPLHASPIEHQAYPATYKYTPSGNFKGWIQYRQIYTP